MNDHLRLTEKDQADIVAALRMFADNYCKTNDCKTRCGELIAKVQTLPVPHPDQGLSL